MAKKTGLAQQFFAHGSDLSGDVGSLENAGSPRAVLDVTGINKSAIERVMAHGDGNMAFTSFFNPAAGQAHAVLSALPTTDVILLWAFGGAIGDIAAMLVAKQVNYDPSRGQDGSLSMAIEAMADGVALEWGTMLTAGLITHSSATNGSSEDNGASSASGLAGVLEIDDIGSGTPTVTIEDSPNDSAWSTLKAFAAVADGAEPTAERVTVTGTVDRYLRITSTGTFTAFDFAVATRRGESVDDVAYA